MTIKQALPLLFGLVFFGLSVAAFIEDTLIFAMGAALAAFGCFGLTQYYAMKKQRLAKLARERAAEVLPDFVIKDSFKDWEYEKRRDVKALRGLPSLFILTSAIMLGMILLAFGNTGLARGLITTQSVADAVAPIIEKIISPEPVESPVKPFVSPLDDSSEPADEAEALPTPVEAPAVETNTVTEAPPTPVTVAPNPSLPLKATCNDGTVMYQDDITRNDYKGMCSSHQGILTKHNRIP